MLNITSIDPLSILDHQVNSLKNSIVKDKYMESAQSRTIKPIDTVTDAVAVMNPELMEGVKCSTCNRYFTDKVAVEYVADMGTCVMCEDLQSEIDADMRMEMV